MACHAWRSTSLVSNVVEYAAVPPTDPFAPTPNPVATSSGQAVNVMAFPASGGPLLDVSMAGVYTRVVAAGAAGQTMTWSIAVEDTPTGAGSHTLPTWQREFSIPHLSVGFVLGALPVTSGGGLRFGPLRLGSGSGF
jgi:hypothetical protein